MKRLDWIAALSKSEFASLRDASQIRHYRAGSTLFVEGQQPRVVMILLEGVVQIYKHDAKANEIHLARFHRHEWIAESAALSHTPYPASGRCESDVEMLEIRLDYFDHHLQGELERAIIHSLQRKIRTLERSIAYQRIGDASRRLGQFLLDHCPTSMTQRKIATLLHVTPETISRCMRRFKQEGYVDVRCHYIRLLDPIKMQTYVEEA